MIYDDDVELLAEALKAAELGPHNASWDIARAVLAALDRQGRLAVRIPESLRGDGPCDNCHTEDNVRWFTDSVFWNNILGGPAATGDPGGGVGPVRTKPLWTCPGCGNTLYQLEMGDSEP